MDATETYIQGEELLASILEKLDQELDLIFANLDDDQAYRL